MKYRRDEAKAYARAHMQGIWAAALQPVRRTLKSTRPPGKPHAHQKYEQEPFSQVGGPVRRPILNLTAEERAATHAAFDAYGLGVEAVEETATAAALEA